MRISFVTARVLCLAVVGLVTLFGAPSTVRADEPVIPERDRDIDTRLQARLDSLSEIEIRDRDDEDVDRRRDYRRDRRFRAGGSAIFEKRINCDAGQSVNKALKNLPGRELVLQLSGTCRESVVVDRPGVTLSGTLYGPAVIDPPEDADGVPIGPAVYALGAHELVLEDLTLTGGTDGLQARGSELMRLHNVHAVENVSSGVSLRDSRAEIIESELSRNFEPLVALFGGYALVYDSVMNDNFYGPQGAYNSLLILIRCEILNNEDGPGAAFQSTARIWDSTVEGRSVAWTISELEFVRTEVDGPVEAYQNSTLKLLGVQFRADGLEDELLASANSMLSIVDSSLDDGTPVLTEFNGLIEVRHSSYANIHTDGFIGGGIDVRKFSEVYIQTSIPVDGFLNCYNRSGAICDPLPTEGMDSRCE